MQNGHGQYSGTFKVKSGLAQMSKGGLIMDVINAEQARIAEEAGACAVMVIPTFSYFYIRIWVSTYFAILILNY